MGEPNARNRHDPTEVNDDKLPIRSGAIPALRVSNGATTGRHWPMKDDADWASRVADSASSQGGILGTSGGCLMHHGRSRKRLLFVNKKKQKNFIHKQLV